MISSLSVLSSNMQMYLVKIKRLEAKSDPVPLSVLADSLNFSHVSVKEMCRKLEEMDLIQYRPYKGAALTKKGDEYAQEILRRHRLWEVFLVDELHFSYEQAHELADKLEHVTTVELADRLDEHLGFPKQNTEGKHIHRGGEAPTHLNEQALSEISAGSSAVYSVNETETSVAEYLRANGIHNGTQINILARTNQLMLVGIGQHKIHLSMQVAEGIRVFADPMKQEVEEENKKIDEVIDMESSETKRKTLKDLKIGERGIVVRVAGSGSVKQRMMDMGLVPGSEVSVVRVAPLGDPIEVSLKGYNLSLRKNEAKDIFIENLQEAR